MYMYVALHPVASTIHMEAISLERTSCFGKLTLYIVKPGCNVSLRMTTFQNYIESNVISNGDLHVSLWDR